MRARCPDNPDACERFREVEPRLRENQELHAASERYYHAGA